MAIITNRISNYRVGSVHRNDSEEVIEIYLYETFGRSASNHIAILSFSTVDRAPRIIWPATGTMNPVRVQYRMESYTRILDILRNEKPLSLVSIRNWNRVTIQTGKEPIGEEES